MARRVVHGGGGGSSSSSSSSGSGAISPSILYAEDKVGTWEAGWDENTYYSRVNQYSPRGQFAIHSHTFSDSAWTPTYNNNRLRIAPFTVDQSTGAMTWGTKSNAFLNSSGYVHSTMSYGFGGSYGVNWGYSAWGSGNTHYSGGCVWRVVNNAVVGGESTGNTNYAGENTSNGNLPIYEHGGTYYYNIPNAQYTSIGSISTAGQNADWATASEHDHGSSTTYIYRCVGKTVGEAHAGVISNTSGIQAMDAQGSNGPVGTQFSEGANQAQAGGIGFELESGKQVFFTSKGTYIRESKTGGLSYKATVTDAAATNSLPNISGGASDLSIVGVRFHQYTYSSSGYAAKEADTFYFYSDNIGQELIKFKITNPTASTIQLERLGAVDLKGIASQMDLAQYVGFCDVTGDDDQFIVASYRGGSGMPSHTIVVDNPIKDA